MSLITVWNIFLIKLPMYIYMVMYDILLWSTYDSVSLKLSSKIPTCYLLNDKGTKLNIVQQRTFELLDNNVNIEFTY